MIFLIFIPWLSEHISAYISFLFISHEAIPLKCFVSDRPLSRETWSVGRAKKKKKMKVKEVKVK